MSDEGDWRITSQESYMPGLALRWARWSTKDPAWQHDHCEFCWDEFPATLGNDDSHDWGWVTADGDRWVCDECFADFRSRFQWTVVDADAQSAP
jgi:hypothetical protein